jgi:hypothetical protein
MCFHSKTIDVSLRFFLFIFEHLCCTTISRYEYCVLFLPTLALLIRRQDSFEFDDVTIQLVDGDTADNDRALDHQHS